MTEPSINSQRISIRAPAVAGSFYPNNAGQLSAMLDDYLDIVAGELNARQPDSPKAIIAPHAGYIYSGPVAGSIYSLIKQADKQITRVVLSGPAHRVYVKGVALLSNTHFATPLGNVSIDTETVNKLTHYPNVQILDEAHRQEHSLEVQVPFLQKVLPDFNLIPLLVGDAEPDQVAEVLDELWGGDETLIVISSDLSHYLDYDAAGRIDHDTTRLIEKLDYKNIGPEQACGCAPMRGLLKLAKHKQLEIKTIDLRNSGDTAGTKDRVVGYGAYALFKKSPSLDRRNERLVFDVIHKSIASGLENGTAYTPKTEDYNDILQKQYAVFITLEINNHLRGCIGTTEATMPLINAAAHYAHAAAFSDPRFKPLTASEYKQLAISVSILTPATEINFSDEPDLLDQLRPGSDGLIITRGNARATFLPVVWETIRDREKFLSELKRKAGINPSETPEQAWRYTTEYYSEKAI